MPYAVVEGRFGCVIKAGTVPGLHASSETRSTAALLGVPGDPEQMVACVDGAAFRVEMQVICPQHLRKGDMKQLWSWDDYPPSPLSTR